VIYTIEPYAPRFAHMFSALYFEDMLRADTTITDTSIKRRKLNKNKNKTIKIRDGIMKIK